MKHKSWTQSRIYTPPAKKKKHMSRSKGAYENILPGKEKRDFYLLLFIIRNIASSEMKI